LFNFFGVRLPRAKFYVAFAVPIRRLRSCLPQGGPAMASSRSPFGHYVIGRFELVSHFVLRISKFPIRCVAESTEQAVRKHLADIPLAQLVREVGAHD
jgi:hypothetical protein